MKVKKLIKELKKMPQNLEVYTAMHDNMAHEKAGYTSSVRHVLKSDHIEDINEKYSDDEEEWVTIAS